MTENVLESIEGVKTVRAYGQEDEDYAKTKKAIDDDVDSWKIILAFEASFQPMFEMVYAISYTIAISLGCYLVVNNNISPGELVSFLIYVGMLYGPLVGLSGVLNFVNSITIANTRVQEVMNIKPNVIDCNNPISIKKFNTIKFDNLCFKYNTEQVLNNVSFEIKSGETIGIVGGTGSGKTTLIKQLLREYNYDVGDILIDNTSIKNYSISDIRNLIGYVPQKHILFRRTVKENILIGNENAIDEEVMLSVDGADFRKDLNNLPKGIETMVSELGGSLSGGQRQRLSIARALVKDPEILILDDSLSAVDAITEENIINNLKQMRNGKTNIIISHRFASISKADRIIVLNNGIVTDIGTQEELMSYDNWYKEQYLKQLKGDRYEKD